MTYIYILGLDKKALMWYNTFSLWLIGGTEPLGSLKLKGDVCVMLKKIIAVVLVVVLASLSVADVASAQSPRERTRDADRQQRHYYGGGKRDFGRGNRGWGNNRSSYRRHSGSKDVLYFFGGFLLGSLLSNMSSNRVETVEVAAPVPVTTPQTPVVIIDNWNQVTVPVTGTIYVLQEIPYYCTGRQYCQVVVRNDVREYYDGRNYIPF
jgi:hypothetical protein